MTKFLIAFTIAFSAFVLCSCNEESADKSSPKPTVQKNDKSILAENEAFSSLKTEIESCRETLKRCVSSENGCNCSEVLVIAEDEILTSGKFLEIYQLKDSPDIILEIQSTDFKSCSGEKAVLTTDRIIIKNEECSKLLEKHGVK